MLGGGTNGSFCHDGLTAEILLKCPESWHWPCSCPRHLWVTLAAPDGAHSGGSGGPTAQGVRGKLPLQPGQAQRRCRSRRFGLCHHLELPAPPYVTLQGGAGHLRWENSVICEILGNISALDSLPLCCTKPRHRSQWKHSFSPFPFPLAKDQISVRVSRLFAETEGNYWGFLLFELFPLHLSALILHIICTISSTPFTALLAHTRSYPIVSPIHPSESKPLVPTPTGN